MVTDINSTIHLFLLKVRSNTVPSIFTGILAGISSAFFLYSLDFVNRLRDQNSILIWGLPLAGLSIGFAFQKWGDRSAQGVNLIIEEIHQPEKTIPARLGPMVLAGTLVTHLFGGSAGREGTAVQLGASLADQVSRLLKAAPEKRLLFLTAGAGAGFGAAIGTPWAGVVFGMEMIQVGRLKLFAWYECLIASFIGYYTVVGLQAPHSQFTLVSIDSIQIQTLFWLGLAGLVFGLAARFFVLMVRFVEWVSSKYISRPAFRPMFFGILLVGLYSLEGTFQYVSLGIPTINDALNSPYTLKFPILKMIFTALTVGSGFKGGEFVPLVFVGTTLGSVLGNWIPVSFSLLGAVGFAAVFAGAANTPITCTIMAVELFGWPIAPYAFIACFTSYFISGHQGIYKSQRITNEKPTRWLRRFI